METSDTYLHLAALTEAPSSSLRQRPRSAWSAAERHAVDLCEVIALVDATYGEDPIQRSTTLAALTVCDIARFDQALLAIGAARERNALGYGYRFLTRGLQTLDHTARQAHIAALLAEYPPIVYRIFNAIDTDVLLQRMQTYLVKQGHLEAARLPAPSAFAAVSAPPVIASANDEPSSSYLLRDNLVTRQLLDEWIGRRGGADYFGEQQQVRVPDYHSICHLAPEKRGLHGPLAYAVVGELAEGAPATGLPIPPPGSQSEAQWRALTQHFRWTLGQAHVGQYHALLWVGSDAEINADFERQLEPVAADCLISAFRQADPQKLPAQGLSFREYEPFGMPALVAAQEDAAPPWLIARLSAETGHWWRNASARLASCAWRRIRRHNYDELYVAYRGDDRAAFLQLWRRLNRDDNIGYAAASGNLEPDALLQRVAETIDSTDSDRLRHLAGSDGWAYQHYWGGGSDEHMTLFFSTRAETTRRVAEYANDGAQDCWLRYW